MLLFTKYLGSVFEVTCLVEVVCMGEILVNVIPVDASVYRDGMAFEIHFGDASANVAVGVARLGKTMTRRVKLSFAPNL
jgi:hypothetical protein